MNSLRCPHCNLTNWANDEICKRCKEPLHVVHDGTPQFEPVNEYSRHGYASEYGYQQSYSTTRGFQAQPYGLIYPSDQQVRTGLAVASMILGIVSLPTSFFLLGLLLAPIGLILGIVSIVRANKHPRVFGGKGFAIAGIATSCFTFFLILPIIAVIAIPNLLAARRAANEAMALRTLNTLYAAEVTYKATTGAGSCGDLNSLIAVSLIPAEMAKPERSGYKYKLEMSDAENCEVHAAPTTASMGSRSFMYSTYDGILRAADKKGAFASYSDPPLSAGQPYFNDRSATRY